MHYFHDALEKQAASTPDTVAVVSWGRQRSCKTYAAVCQRSNVLSAGLLKRLMAVEASQRGTEPLVVAVQLSRTHPDFVPLLVAASRVGLPVVLLSTDLPDAALQDSRNTYILETLHPWMLITDAVVGAGAGGALSVAVEELGVEEPVDLTIKGSTHIRACDVWCFMFTGGTQRTKIVQVTHAMLLHERTAYHELWQPKSLPAVVLAHTSVYWGGSALGQLSIALAFGGTTVFTEVVEISELRRCISEERVTVLGLVPDHLDLLAPQFPATELPAVEMVFTWGERLPPRLVDRWRTHPRALLRELLISTEYWLCLWADPMLDGTLRTVGAADLLLLAEDGQQAVVESGVGVIGELCISGPMVMRGYVPGCGPPDSEVFHIPADGSGRRFFRTRDLVRRVPGGIIYKGRSDMMTKYKGKWVDMLVVEDRLAGLPSVTGAKILPDPEHEHFHAFVVFEVGQGAELREALDAVRGALPPRTQLWQLPSLPRHPVTRKVDANRLLAMATGRPMSWPVEGDPQLSAAPGPLRARFLQKALNQLAWTFFGIAAALGVAEENFLARQVTLSLALLQLFYVRDGMASSSRSQSSEGGPCAGSAAVTCDKTTLAWFVAVLLAGPLTPARLARAVGSLATLAYTWLTLTYADDARKTSQIARMIMTVVDEVPGWKMGTFLLLSFTAKYTSSFLSNLAGATLASATCFGVITAARRGRLLAWPVIFWTVGIGHQVGMDCSNWLYLDTWRRHASNLFFRFLSLPGSICEALTPERFRASAAWSSLDVMKSTTVTEASAAAVSSELSAGEQPSQVGEEDASPAPIIPTCSRCKVEMGGERWPAHDFDGQLLCDSCGAQAASEREAWATEWLGVFLAASADEAMKDTGGEAAAPPTVDGKAEDAHADGDSAECGPLAKRYKTDGDAPNTADGGEVEVAAAEAAHQRSVSEAQSWWWYRHNTDIFDFTSEELDKFKIGTASGGAAASLPLSPELRPLCSIVAEVEPLLQPVHAETVIMGVDSLRVARLSTAIRNRLGKKLTAPQIREVRTVAELAALVAEATDVNTPGSVDCAVDAAVSHLSSEPLSREYAVWYSPGQCSAMGHWVLRSEDRIDRDALVRATQQLVERHAALRVKMVDPLRYTSFLYDAAALFTLYGPMLIAGPAPARLLRRLISWAFTLAWPRVRCYSRQELYGARLPETAAPVEVVQIHGGQNAFEREIRSRRSNLVPPGAITGYELFCHLADVWEYHNWKGSFTILKPGEGGPVAEAALVGNASLIYVDAKNGEWGPLVSPNDTRWQPPPYGFPALFFVPLCSGAVVWLRLEGADEVRVCYKEAGANRNQANRNQPVHHLAAFRAAPRRARVHEPVVISFLGCCMWHAFADGNCYFPLVQDLLALYDAARGRPAAPLAPLGNPFAELERRLFDTFLCRAAPLRSSLRGSMFRFNGRGFGHTLGLLPGAIAAITATSGQYHIPLDVTLLGLLVIAMARTDAVDLIEFTLYAPMRDGDANSMAVGLFADWRDLSLSVDIEHATTLGTILQVFHKIQHRKWTVFNALRKPDRTVVNIHPMQFDPIAGFVQLGENMWHGGDKIGKPDQRTEEMPFAAQPANFVIEQQDDATWWVLAGVAHDMRTTNWMRAFVQAYREALHSFLFDPLRLVHLPLPSDSVLLRQCEEEAKASEALWNWN